MESERYYVTTSIPYVNGAPHLGHALEMVQVDTLARFHRQLGDDTRFLTGTDDNALKNVRSAEALGVATQALVDTNARRFEQLRAPLALSFDDFIRTSSDQRHLAGARKLWQACVAAGDIYTRDYQGLYCVACELFYDNDELEDGLCPVHHIPVELVAEENYFFRLSRYRDAILSTIESDQLRIVPEHRRNEVLSFVHHGLEDFSVSRSLERARGWGIPVPGDARQVMYVWFDALGNYITALDYATSAELYRDY
jgi:methionyl-tRNA synthetase